MPGIKITSRDETNVCSASASDQSEYFQQQLEVRTKQRNGIILNKRSLPERSHGVLKALKEVELVLACSLGTKTELSTCHRRAWNLFNLYQGAALFATLTTNKKGSVTVKLYSGEVDWINPTKPIGKPSSIGKPNWVTDGPPVPHKRLALVPASFFFIR